MSQAPVATHPRAGRPLLLCFSHLRWDFVTQRPQHLLTRAARTHRVVYWEEPMPAEGVPRLELLDGGDGVTRAVPRLPAGLDEAAVDAAQRRLLDGFLAAPPGGGQGGGQGGAGRPGAGRPGERMVGEGTAGASLAGTNSAGAVPAGAGGPAVAWFYTPMAMGFAGHLDAGVTVYDCMDELSAFHFASPRLLLLERHLFRRADLVFTGGRSLYEGKRARHSSVHCFPSSIDAAHFGRARPGGGGDGEPADQAAIPHPRVGFFGVVDERMDLALLGAVAALRPDWQFVMIGPVAKIDPDDLPRAGNVHWLGGRGYADLPAYLSGWDAGFMPFALNEATRFISPTKTPEYLAAGVPVVSTPIADVVRPWGEEGLVGIAAGAPATVAALDEALGPRGRSAGWLARVDRKLARLSWDRTWSEMLTLIREAQAGGAAPPSPEHAGAAGEASHV